MFNYQEQWASIKYLLPIYGPEGGNQTQLGLSDLPPRVDQRRVKTVLKILGQIFALDLAALRRNCGRLIQRQKNVPLMLHPQMVLLPLYTRKPVTKDDGATGFVVLSKIKALEPLKPLPPTSASNCSSSENAHSRLIFHDDTTLDVPQQMISLYRLQGEAWVIQQRISHAGLDFHPSSTEKTARTKIRPPKAGTGFILLPLRADFSQSGQD